MGAQAESGLIRVWDPVIRIGHWVLVVAFATAYLSEGEPEWLHSYAGYLIAATVALRVIWGFIGPRRARFSDFVTSPGRVFGYLRDLVTGRADRHIGHSPAGGAMTVALLVMLGVTAVSGMGLLAVEEGRGPLAGIVAAQPQDRAILQDDDAEGGHRGAKGGNAWEEIHETAANLTLLLIVLHLGGVALASLAHRENLVRAMATGKKRP
ncbi:hypothetical protein CCR83_05800 [Rhodobacter veldkampii DSM 11550]|uniref:Cytochrome B n=1 Tax=Phaeovulum veldkampii DSM 11550 TaxID=1185920 RepID=A0A2T4JM00_9RHOB|nr:cytochrome b/b6 domain-containing protein [Phaeovulum veldkampii]MBK5945977.1 hypothetical protein [Phaeovulum veldkampii DSM 11550]PTE18902.1 cytochrome B [Phaeovulum veldkampii DSM 11550]TDQ64627.1 cytochrome b [Phaeovulum veldkampii DSM 11550]